MPGTSTANQRLDSWKAIARYVGRDVRTAIRWEKEKGLPIRRVPGGKRQAVFAYPQEIDAWLQGQDTISQGVETTVVASTQSPPRPAVDQGHAPSDERELTRKRSPKTFAIIGASGLIVAATLIATTLWRTSRIKITLSDESQITNDGAPKLGLVTDGKLLYFGETRGGQTRISSVPVGGGAVREIRTPFAQVTPEDISPDHRKLLVLAWDANAQAERSLWVVPLDGTDPRPIGTVFCHSAAWSPDGNHIAFATGRSIYLTTESSLPKALHTFTSLPEELHWSLDGRRLGFWLRDGVNQSGSMWEAELTGGQSPEISSLVPTHIPMDVGTRESRVIDRDGGQFIVTKPTDTDATVLFLVRSRLAWRPKFDLTELAKRKGIVTGVAVDALDKKLYLISGHSRRYELEGFNLASRDFKPFLPGISGIFVDFSRNGKWITYVRLPEKTLWISRDDGSSARQIPIPTMEDVELPRWSPDGKLIAFMGKFPGQAFRIYVVPVAGGGMREASFAEQNPSENQGAPTWSPDGKWIAYGNVRCQEMATCAIRRVDVSRGQQVTLPASDGLETARWSPDGRFIAALRPLAHEVELFDIHSQQWRALAEGITGNDLAWAADSMSLYASNPIGDSPAVVQISIKSGRVRSIADLSDFGKLTGEIPTWFAVGPNNTVIFSRIIDSDEIYSFDYKTR